jgi:hypothetical protein
VSHLFVVETPEEAFRAPISCAFDEFLIVGWFGLKNAIISATFFCALDSIERMLRQIEDTVRAALHSIDVGQCVPSNKMERHMKPLE